VEQFGGVEAEHVEIPKVNNGFAANSYAESVSGIIDEFQPVAFGNVSQGIDIAWMAIDVNWQNGSRPGGD
jgi:hypothetical protein